MPIFPRYQIPSAEIPTVRLPVPDVLSNSNATLAQALGATVQQVGQAYLQVQQRKQALVDATKVANAVNAAEESMDVKLNEMLGDRSTHPRASVLLAEHVTENEGQWLRGLTPEQQMEVKSRVGGKTVDYLRKARGMENAYAIDEARTALTAAAESARRHAYDRSVPDAYAMGAIYTFRPPVSAVLSPEGELVEPARAAERTYNGPFARALEDAVRTHLIPRAEADKMLRDVELQAAYGRLERLISSDNPAQVQRGIDLINQENADPGSTFVYHVVGHDRNRALKEGFGQLHAIQSRAHSNAEWQRAEEKRRREAVEKPQITLLTREALNGQLSVTKLDEALAANQMLQENPAAYEHLRKLISDSAKDSPTDQVVYGRLWADAIRGRLTVNQVLPHAGYNLARKDAEHLLTVNSNRGIVDDDLFKRGLTEIEDAVKPPIGVKDEAGRLRFSEASKEYYDRALVMFERGERAKLPSLAREIADRWREQARPLTVIGPRSAIRHAAPNDTRESAAQKTYDAWVAQYGTNKTAWPPTVLAEYNRQMRMIEALPTAEAQRKAGERQAGPAAKSKRSTNPF